MFTLWHWTNDPAQAACADAAGVDRIGVDLDQIGKEERQAGMGHWMSPHQMNDIAVIASNLSQAQLFVRTNQLHEGSHGEIEQILSFGPEFLMLPNFEDLESLARYVEMVAGRAQVVPLVERRAALGLVGEFASLGITEFHVGLNDLSIDFGVADRLALLAHPELEAMADHARRIGLRFGIGGVARAGDDTLPIPSDVVIAQHARLGSTGAMLARCFWTDAPLECAEIMAAVQDLRAKLTAAPDPAAFVRQRLLECIVVAAA